MVKLLKKLLKANNLVALANARWKESQVEGVYQRTVEHYRSRSPQGDFRQLLAGRTTNRLSRVLVEKPHVFYMGTDEQQDRGGTLQALERLGRLTVFRHVDGTYGHNPRNEDPHFRIENGRRLWEQFEQLAANQETPNILLTQSWASFIDGEVFDRIRKVHGTLIANIAMDDRHQYWGRRDKGRWGGTYGLIPHIDFALTAAPECVDWYLKEGCPALFFPEASDPAIFRPMPELPKIHDICFVGARYGIREEIVMALREAGFEVTAFGSGWERGRIDTEEVPRLFAQSKIVLGVGTIGHCRQFCSLKMRDFDGPMSGSFYLTQANSDLDLFYSIGHEIATYRTVADCVDQAKRYLQNDLEREQVARAGYARASRDHTWEQRFVSVFAELRRVAIAQ